MAISRIVPVLLAGVIFLTGSQSRVDADGSSKSMDASTGSNYSSSGNSKSKSSKNSSSAGKGKSSSALASFPLRLIGVAAGFAIGTPICGIRKPIDEEKYGVDDMTGGSDKKRTVIPAKIFWAPFAVVSGALEAPFFAFNNALVNYDKPFSKEQFSLGAKETEASKIEMNDIEGTSER